MSRGYDRDYDADYAHVHQVPVEPMGFRGLSDRSRRRALEEDRWETGGRGRPRPPDQARWLEASNRPRPARYGPREDYDRGYGAHRRDRHGDFDPGPYRSQPTRWRWPDSRAAGRQWGTGEPPRYTRDFESLRGPDEPPRYARDFESPRGPARTWAGRGPEHGWEEGDSGRRYDREYRGYGRPAMPGRREEMPWDIDRPSLEGPVPGYPERTPFDAWGVYRPAWFGGGAPSRHDRERGAWSYGAQRRSMYEASGSRPRAPEHEGRRGPRQRPGHWSWSD